MRILHLVHAEGIYGAELILVYLAREMQRLGHEAVIGSIQDPGTGTTEFESFAADCGLEVLPVRIRPRPTPDVVVSLLRTVRSARIDVIHSHGYKADILLGLLPRRWRGPMITTAHGWTYPPRFTALWLYQLIDRLSLRRLDRVVVVAPHMLQVEAVSKLPAGRTAVICNGIPSLQQRMEDNQRRRIKPLPEALIRFLCARPTLVAIGRLSLEKGFDVLLEAFARAASVHPDFQLALIGDGPQGPALRAQVTALGLVDRVHFAGYVEGADRALEHASAFVMSSFTEGLPVALLEAMQWKVPIVATRVGAIPLLLGEGSGGLLVPPRNVGALADALGSVMQADTSLRERVAAAYSAATTTYSSARMAREYVAVYERASADT